MPSVSRPRRLADDRLARPPASDQYVGRFELGDVELLHLHERVGDPLDLGLIGIGQHLVQRVGTICQVTPTGR